jgi:hypothetical protein
LSEIESRFNAALDNPLSEQRARTPIAEYISRHDRAFHAPKAGFESAIASSLVALRDYAVAHECTYGSPLAQDGVLGDAWLDMLRGLRALLNGELGRLDGGFLDGAICNLHRAAGFTGEL